MINNERQICFCILFNAICFKILLRHNFCNLLIINTNNIKMNSLIKLSMVIVLVFFQSCDSAKKATNADNSNTESIIMNEKLINDGYSVGAIKYTDNGDCSYTIIDDKTKSKLDPINMSDKKFEAFKSKSTKVYFKYRSLRRANRCSDARPIEIVDMQKA